MPSGVERSRRKRPPRHCVDDCSRSGGLSVRLTRDDRRGCDRSSAAAPLGACRAYRQPARAPARLGSAERTARGARAAARRGPCDRAGPMHPGRRRGAKVRCAKPFSRGSRAPPTTSTSRTSPSIASEPTLPPLRPGASRAHVVGRRRRISRRRARSPGVVGSRHPEAHERRPRRCTARVRPRACRHRGRAERHHDRGRRSLWDARPGRWTTTAPRGPRAMRLEFDGGAGSVTVATTQEARTMLVAMARRARVGPPGR